MYHRELCQLGDQWNMTASGSMGCVAVTSRHLVLCYYHYYHHATHYIAVALHPCYSSEDLFRAITPDYIHGSDPESSEYTALY